MSTNSRPRGPRDYSPLIITIVILLFSCSFLTLIVVASAKIKLAKETQRATTVAPVHTPAHTPVEASPTVSPPSGVTRPASTIPAPAKRTYTPTSTQVAPTPTPLRSTPTPTRPAATSTPTSIPSTVISFATFTPTPTATPTPTDTAIPTATATPIPTDTATPTPTATATFTPELIPSQTPSWGTVTADSLNLRAGPGTDYDIIVQLLEGIIVELIARNEDGDWLQIRLYDGREGWVAAEWIQTEADIDSLPIASVES